MFDWKWYLRNQKKDKNVKVFSCFSCGGGSSMGYKKARFDVIGNCEGVQIDPATASKTFKYLKYMKDTDASIKDIKKRLYNKESNFNDVIYRDCNVAQTLTVSGQGIRACDKSWLSDGDYRNISSFPQDYDFGGENVKYICGMSVPPNMMANIANEIYKQWLKQEL